MRYDFPAGPDHYVAVRDGVFCTDNSEQYRFALYPNSDPGNRPDSEPLATGDVWMFFDDDDDALDIRATLRPYAEAWAAAQHPVR